MSAAADNSIRAQFQPEVDEFIDDLNTFATGSYLQTRTRTCGKSLSTRRCCRI